MSIWIPPKVSRELREETRRYESDVLNSLERDGKLEHFDRQLKEIDPRLFLVKARDNAMPGTGLRPGFWHVVRDNSDKSAPPTVMTIEGPQGEYVEPNSSIFEMLRRNDLQREGSIRERREHEQRLEAAKAKEKEKELAEWTQEAEERFVAGNRAFVSMSDATPWTQSAKAKRAARR